MSPFSPNREDGSTTKTRRAGLSIHWTAHSISSAPFPTGQSPSPNEEEGIITAGVIHDVLHGEKFTAHRGDGAFLNDTRIRVNTQKDFDKLLVATGIKGGQSDSARSILTRQLAIMMNQTAGVRRFGAASLDMAWVACGRLDAFWEDDIQPWDVAAGIIIAREAGAICCDYTTTKKMDDFQLLTAKRILAVSSHQSRAVSRMLRDAQQVT